MTNRALLTILHLTVLARLTYGADETPGEMDGEQVLMGFVPEQALIFLIIVIVLLVLISVAFLYIYKIACFHQYGGRIPCIDVMKPKVEPKYDDETSSEEEEDGEVEQSRDETKILPP